jgi:LysM repeat protein
MTHTYQIPTFYLFFFNILAPVVAGVVIYREVQFFQDFSLPAFSFWSALPIIVAWGGSIILFGIRNLYNRTQDKFIFVDNDFSARTKEDGINTLQEFGFQVRWIVGVVIFATIGSMGYTLYHAFTLNPQDYIANIDTYREVTINFSQDQDVTVEELYLINNLTPILFDTAILSQELILKDPRDQRYTVRVGQNPEGFENRIRTAISLDNQIESMQLVSLTSLMSTTDPRLGQMQYYLNQEEPSNQTFKRAWDEHAGANGPTLLQYRGYIENITINSVNEITEQDLLEEE